MDAAILDRALGALAGVTIGDAMGMPTQTLNRTQIAQTYGELTDFVPTAICNPVSAGLVAGPVTDDTEQSIPLAQHLIVHHGHVNQRKWAQELLDWERGTHIRGVNDFLGPSTKRALEALQNGVPVGETGRHGTRRMNSPSRLHGRLMKISPVSNSFPRSMIDV